jgi:dethiobiotin synthetase
VKAKFPDTIFVCGIGTDVGKTMVAALLVKAMQADYWKPIQTGSAAQSDRLFVEKWAHSANTILHPETYHFPIPASPHIAAKLDNAFIDLSAIQLPITINRLVVESAGGILVPLNDRETNLDLIKQLNIPIILVANEYLGSINHTILSIEILRQHHCDLLGLIFNGEAYLDNETIIAKHSQVPVLGRLEKMPEINSTNMAAAAEKLRLSLANYFDLN